MKKNKRKFRMLLVVGFDTKKVLLYSMPTLLEYSSLDQI